MALKNSRALAGENDKMIRKMKARENIEIDSYLHISPYTVA